MGLEKSKLKLNPLTGKFDLITADNHSYKEIPAGKVATIRAKQQMIVDGMVIIDGQLNIDGELSILSDVDLDTLPPYHIQAGEVYQVGARRQFFSAVPLLIDGMLINDGLLILGD